MTGRINITISDGDRIEAVEDAISAVENDLDKEVHRTRGRPAEDEITMAEAIEQMALAYTGDLTVEGATIGGESD